MQAIVLFLAFLGLSARAEEPLNAKQLETLKSVANVAADAEANLPPCLGHERLAEAVFRVEPPRSCPRARKLYEIEGVFEGKLRANCQEMTRWAEEQIRSPAPGSCPYALKKLTVLLNEIENERTKANDLYPDSPENDPEQATGEFARAECRLPGLLLMQHKMKQEHLAKRNYGYANTMVDEASCGSAEKPESLAEEYSRYLREGEEKVEVR